MHNPIEEFIELNIADRNSPIDLINRIFDDMENSASENIEYQLSDTHQTQLSNLFENIIVVILLSPTMRRQMH